MRYLPEGVIDPDWRMLTNSQLRKYLINDVFCKKCGGNLNYLDRHYLYCELSDELRDRNFNKWLKEEYICEEIRAGYKIYGQE